MDDRLVADGTDARVGPDQRLVRTRRIDGADAVRGIEAGYSEADGDLLQRLRGESVELGVGDLVAVLEEIRHLLQGDDVLLERAPEPCRELVGDDLGLVREVLLAGGALGRGEPGHGDQATGGRHEACQEIREATAHSLPSNRMKDRVGGIAQQPSTGFVIGAGARILIITERRVLASRDADRSAARGLGAPHGSGGHAPRRSRDALGLVGRGGPAPFRRLPPASVASTPVRLPRRRGGAGARDRLERAGRRRLHPVPLRDEPGGRPRGGVQPGRARRGCERRVLGRGARPGAHRHGRGHRAGGTTAVAGLRGRGDPRRRVVRPHAGRCPGGRDRGASLGLAADARPLRRHRPGDGGIRAGPVGDGGRGRGKEAADGRRLRGARRDASP